MATALSPLSYLSSPRYQAPVQKTPSYTAQSSVGDAQPPALRRLDEFRAFLNSSRSATLSAPSGEATPAAPANDMLEKVLEAYRAPPR